MEPTTPEAAEPTPLSDAARAKLAQYETFERTLDGALGDYLRTFPTYVKGFVGLVCVGLAFFAFGPLAGVWASACATMVAVGGYFMLKARIWEIEVELALVREELARMRGEVMSKRPRPS